MPEHRIYGVGGASHLVDAKNTECTDDQEATDTSSERLSDLLTLSYEPMLIWRLDGVIEFWNAGAERLYGFTAAEAVGHVSHALLQTKFPVEFADVRTQLRKENNWSGQLRHICKDGHEVFVDSRMQLLGVDTVLEVNRDVTEVKALISHLRSRACWRAGATPSGTRGCRSAGFLLATPTSVRLTIPMQTGR